MLLLVPELAPQQFGGIVGNLSQPLLEGLATFVVESVVGFLVARPLVLGVGLRLRLAGCSGGLLAFVFRQAGRGRRGLGLLRIDGRRVARRPLAASGWRALLARFLALFLVLAGLLLRRLFLALAQQFLDQGLVALRGDQLRLALQGLFVGVDGGFQFALAGQGVATVVVIVAWSPWAKAWAAAA